MPKVPSPGQAAEKLVRVAPTRQQDYEAGIKDPSTDWAGPTAAARESYEAGVQEAIQGIRFTRGVHSAGNQKWADKTVNVGAGRWSGGVRAGAKDYEEAVAPFFAVIERTNLQPRGPRGDPRNYQRSEAMGRALSEARKKQ